jgi:hypothetical protein
MPTYYVDDGGNATDPYDTWAKAATSLSALDDAKSLASGDIVYIGHNHVCPFTHSASRTIAGPTSGAPCVIISATQGSDPPTYQKSSTDQVDTSEGAYSITLDGSFALYGVRIKSGANVLLAADADETSYARDCTFAVGANGIVSTGDNYGRHLLFDCHVDLTADGTTNRSGAIIGTGFTNVYIDGLTFTNPGYRTGIVISSDQASSLHVSGVNCTGMQNLCELVGSSASSDGRISNCLLVSGQGVLAFSPTRGMRSFYIINCGTADAPQAMTHQGFGGETVSTGAIYRSSGATVETINVGWLITTLESCSEYGPYYTPWMVGACDAGSRTFDVFITNDTADFTDAQAWLEVEYLTTSDSPLSATARDQRATITTTAVAQTDDTSSTWNGTGPAFTYKQKLSVTVTVGEAGQYRARVAVGVASIAGSRNFYIDPKVTVT